MGDKPTSRRITKAFHHKSRNGCRTCKTRRVKCDEKRPACSNCIRIGSEACIYDAPKLPSSRSTTQNDRHYSANEQLIRLSPESTPSPSYFGNINQMNTIDLPESASRRKLELRLLHNFMAHLIDPYPNMSKPASVIGWLQEVPGLSLEFDNVQYMMLACSGAHLMRTLPDNREVLNSHQVYMTLALRDQQKAVANFDHGNRESIVYTALLHFIYSFTTLWNRSTDPYVAPTDWLRVGKGVRSVLVNALDLFPRTSSDPNDPNRNRSLSPVMMVRNAPPDFKNESLLSKENLLPLPVLPDYSADDSTTTDDETRDTYEKALSYIGSMYVAVASNEPVFSLLRRCMGFSIFVPKLFIELVEEHRPRALVILAMYFALMSKAQSVWWVGDIPHREILAIQRVLPLEWQGAMRWPLVVAGLMPF